LLIHLLLLVVVVVVVEQQYNLNRPTALLLKRPRQHTGDKAKADPVATYS